MSKYGSITLLDIYGKAHEIEPDHVYLAASDGKHFRVPGFSGILLNKPSWKLVVLCRAEFEKYYNHTCGKAKS